MPGKRTPAARHSVSFRPSAETDLFQLYESIAAQSGLAIAGSYIDRIEAACLGLEAFPKRGRARDDIAPGLRTLGFERRALIVFQVRNRDVVILRILYGGQDFERIVLSAED